MEVKFSDDFLKHPLVSPFIDFEPNKKQRLPAIDGFSNAEVLLLKEHIFCEQLDRAQDHLLLPQPVSSLTDDFPFENENGLEVYSDTTETYQTVKPNKLVGTGFPDSLFQFKIPAYTNKYEALKKRKEHTEKARLAMRALFRCDE